MESKNQNDDLQILYLVRNGKRVFKTIANKSDKLISVYESLLERKKITISDIIVDRQGIELDLHAIPAKFVEEENLYLKSDFESQEDPSSKFDDMSLFNQNKNPSENDQEFRISLPKFDMNQIEWTDLDKTSQLKLVQALCKYSYRKFGEGLFEKARSIWHIQELAVDSCNPFLKQKGKSWVPKVVVNLELCKKKIKKDAQVFFESNENSTKYFAPLAVEIGAINMSSMSDENKFASEYTTSKVSDIISTYISSKDNPKQEILYHWAITLIMKTTEVKRILAPEAHKSKQNQTEHLKEEKEFILADGVYNGVFIEGKMNGYGTYHFGTGDRYEGEFKDDKMHGEGVYYYMKTGDRYEGDFVRNIKSGKGTIYFAGGNKYTGEFKNDTFNGHGVFTWSNGDYYEGSYKNGECSGKGTCYFANGDKYIGDYLEDKHNGVGVFYFANGERYEGEFENGKYGGQGTLFFASGDKYVGSFKNGAYNGHGTIFFGNGNKYTGEFKDGLYHGEGEYTWKNGDRYEGQYREGMCCGAGTCYFKNGNKFIGEYKNDTYNGKGVFYFAVGERYEGNFRNGKYNGQGTFYFLNGDKYIGGFEDGKYHGYGVLNFTTGNKYEGEFKNGIYSGHGTFHWANGDKYIGMYKNGLRNGFGVTYYLNGMKEEGQYVDDHFQFN